MPRVVILAKTFGGTGKAMVVGAFTKPKKVWGAIEVLEGGQPTPTCTVLPGLVVQDDVLETTLPALYRHLLAILRQNGRAVLGRNVDGKFVRQYLLLEAELNRPRVDDLDEFGRPRPCPLAVVSAAGDEGETNEPTGEMEAPQG